MEDIHIKLWWIHTYANNMNFISDPEILKQGVRMIQSNLDSIADALEMPNQKKIILAIAKKSLANYALPVSSDTVGLLTTMQEIVKILEGKTD